MHRTALLLALALPATAQATLSFPRSDGANTPAFLYPAQNVPPQSCAPLAIVSHGAGGSERGYRYLAEALSQAGYTALVLGHRESGLAALRTHVLANGRAGILDLVADPKAESARILDVSAALTYEATQCKAPFKVLLGHSMGAETTVLEAGAKNTIALPAGQNRFDAYVALSPEGPGIIFPAQAWSGIRAPILFMNGSLEQNLNGGRTDRQLPWKQLPGIPSHCQWLGVVTGAAHTNFAGNGDNTATINPIITTTVVTFLREVRTGTCPTPPPIDSLTLQTK